jgi:Fungal Zn(2)-Cys(6) binuclear cluster domain
MESKPATEKSQPAQASDKLKRRPNKKTKTGCKTCRIRRVKCDEGKPNCRRCEIFGVECDGYMEPKSRAPARKPPPPAILPRSGADSRDITIPQLTYSTKRQIPRISPPLKENEIFLQGSVQGFQANASK